jgi:uncharacterized membrane protein
MDRDLVIAVPTESAAYEALRALRTLDDEGSIELYSAAVITKKPDGQVQLQDKRENMLGLGTLLGASTGALVGLLAGPAGAAAGAAAGGGAGLSTDLAYSGFSGDFIKTVGDRLKPGTSAVVAYAFEDWTTPVDSAVASLGATVFRQSTGDVTEAQLKSEMKRIKEERQHLEDEIARSTDEENKGIEASVAELDRREAELKKKIDAGANTMQQKLNDQIASIKKKMSAANGDAKRRHEQRVEKLSQFAAKQKEYLRQIATSP